MSTVDHYLDNFYKRLERETQEVVKILQDSLKTPDWVDQETFVSIYREAIMQAFMNPNLAELVGIKIIGITRTTAEKKSYLDLLHKAIACQVNFYDALKTYYLYVSEDLATPADQTWITTEEIKILLSETFDLTCDESSIEPTSDRANDLKYKVPEYLTSSLKHYSDVLRGAGATITDAHATLQNYIYTMHHIGEVFNQYHKLKGVKQ